MIQGLAMVGSFVESKMTCNKGVMHVLENLDQGGPLGMYKSPS